MKTNSFLMAIAAAELASVAATPARADVEYTTFGTSPSYYPGNGYYVAGAATSLPPGNSTLLAGEFTASFTGTMTSLDVGISTSGSATNATATLSLQANNPVTDLPTGTTLLTLGNVTAVNTTGSVQNLTLGTSVPLVAGTKYWLVMSPSTTASFVGWGLSPNIFGGTAMSFDSGASYTSAGGSVPTVAFDINANTLGVPEPSVWTMIILGAGAAGWCAASKRRRAE